jgi:hypothetical protein
MTLNDATLKPSGTDVPPAPPSGATPPAGQPDTPPGQKTGVNDSSGQNQTTPPTGTAPGQTPPQGQAGQGDGGADTDVKLTKNELDLRIAKAARSGEREVLKALGFTDLDSQEAIDEAKKSLANLVKVANDYLQSQLTAEQKVQQEKDDLTVKADTWEKKFNEEKASRQKAEERLDALVRDGALQRGATGARHPEDVVTWAKTNKPDLYKKVLKDDGSTDETQVTAIVDACKEARKDWFEIVPGSPSNAGARPPAAGVQPEARVKAAQEVMRGSI